MTRLITVLVTALTLFCAAPLFAQGADVTAGATSQIRITIVDASGAAVPGATVIITRADGTPEIATADQRGVATVSGLAAETVQVHVEYPGFAPYDSPLVLRPGANTQTATLKVAGVKDQVVVRDNVEDARGNAMTTTLEQADIDQLPSDPDELQAVLEQMTGGQGAVFQVNGFQGGTLPPRDQIRQIRFRTNSFAADNHDAGRVYVEIITKPNVRNWSGNASFNYRTSALNARNAFADTQTPEQFRRFSMGIRGPIVQGKTSLSVYVDGNRSFDSETVFAINPSGGEIRSQAKQPYEQTNVTVGIEHALTDKQTLRVEYRQGDNANHNQGVGGFAVAERAYESNSTSQRLRVQAQGLIGATTLNEFRVEVNRGTNSATSFSDAAAINIIEAYSAGGAGQNSHSTNTTFEVADNVDFNAGRNHAMRAGFLLNGGEYSNFDQSNANGTFTFATIADFNAGRPLQFTKRVGELNTSFRAYQLGMYWQDDIRLNKSFSYSIGIRNELQSLLDDKINLMPRLGFTYTPGGGKTNIRGGYGIFHDWYDTGLYDQTLRLNGVGQKDQLYLNPGYPNPLVGANLVTLLGGRVQAGSDLKMPFIQQASIGIEHPVNAALSVDATYQLLRSRNVMRSINVNAPNEFGVRPEPNVATVTQFESTGRSDSDRLNFGATYRPAGGGFFMRGNYTLAFAENTSNGALSLPMNNFDPDADWGPSSQDIRHRVNLMANVPLPAGLRTFIRAFGQSGSPYTITTGRDTNGDGTVNDRPDGVGRNSARASGRFDMSVRLSKSITLGGAQTPTGAGGARGALQQRGMGGGGGGRGGGFGRDGGGGGKTVEFFVQADNVLNRVNYTNFSGNILAPYFGKPTAAAQARRIQVGMDFRF